MSKVYTIEMIENYTTYGYGEAGKMFKSSNSLAGTGVEFTFGFRTQAGGPGIRWEVNFWNSDCVGRDVTGGPVSQGAKASLSPQATMIASTPIKLAPVEPLNYGDYIVLAGLDTILKVVPPAYALEYPGLEVVTTTEPTVDYSELVAEVNAKPVVQRSESYWSS